MADQKGTGEIELIAQRTVDQQVRVCEVHRDSLNEKLRTLSDLAQSNMRSVSELAKVVAVMAKSIEPLYSDTQETQKRMDSLEDDVTRLTRRPAFWAAVGSSLPVAVGVLWELIRNKP